MGGAGGILVASHIVGPQMRAMVDEPERRDAIHEELADVFEALGVTTNPIPIKTALNLLGFEVGGFRLPIVDADESRDADDPRHARAAPASDGGKLSGPGKRHRSGSCRLAAWARSART